jgi:hypothetical protein
VATDASVKEENHFLFSERSLGVWAGADHEFYPPFFWKAAIFS